MLSRPDRRSRDAYLAEVAAALWPAPTEVSIAGRGKKPPAARDYLLIPSAQRPKLVVPSSPRRVAAAAIRNYNTAATSRSQRMKISALVAGVRLGLALVLSDRLRIEQDASRPADLITHLSRALGRRVDVCVYISPPRAVRKPVMQLLADDGTTVAFAKLGINRFTDGLVRAEGDAISRLGTVDWTTLRVPAVVHAGNWQGHELLVQSAFARGGDPAAHIDLVARAMDELARSASVRRERLDDSLYLRGVLGRIKDIPHDETAEVLRSAAAELVRCAGAVQLDFGRWHGDWTPWNMTIATDRALVWDWEKFDDGVPIGFDAVHYAVQHAIVVEQLRPEAAFEQSVPLAARLLSKHGNNAAHPEIVSWLYAIEIAVRYVLDREPEAGSRAGQVSTWLPPVMRRMASRVRAA
jgi:hypothetical protein